MSLVLPLIINDKQAASASDILDIDTISSGCDEILNQLNTINTIHNDFNNTVSFIDVNALSIDEESPLVEKTNDCDKQIRDIVDEIESILNKTKELAISEYNGLQNRYNDELEREMSDRFRES